MTFEQGDLRKLKEAYLAAYGSGKDRFTFGEEVLFTSFAKYLIQHLETEPMFMKEK
jgi:hypothetical protein